MKHTLCTLVAISCALVASGCANKKPPVARAEAPPRAEVAPPAPSRVSAMPETADQDEESWFRSATVEELQKRLSDVYFDYDHHELKSDARDQIQKSYAWLAKPYNTVVIEVEGHCDERGTPNYNLALGDRRADTVASYLLSLGFPRERMRTISYGKERPECTESQEGCWWKNRRAHFRIAAKQGRASED
jgi:peptidoglycan-associated lipoprotein